MNTCEGDIKANALLISLLDGKVFNLPEVDFNGDIFDLPPTTEDPSGYSLTPLTNDSLTTRRIEGEGTFDAIMEAMYHHLKREFNEHRIAGAEYTKAYIGVTQSSLQSAVQYLLNRDNAYWQSKALQQQAKLADLELVKARVAIEQAKAELAAFQYTALTAEANYGLTKIKIATEDANLCLLKSQLDSANYTLENILPEQKALLSEQVEGARAQTLDNRRDGTLIKGSVGKQKDLHSQQITSFQRDAETKVFKILADTWITQKTIDEGIISPDIFTNLSINTVGNKLVSNANLNG